MLADLALFPPLFFRNVQLLDKLPQTVRGMGMTLLGGHQPFLFGDGLQQGKRHRLCNLAGFIAVVRFEEVLNARAFICGCRCIHADNSVNQRKHARKCGCSPHPARPAASDHSFIGKLPSLV